MWRDALDIQANTNTSEYNFQRSCPVILLGKGNTDGALHFSSSNRQLDPTLLHVLQKETIADLLNTWSI